MGVPSTPADPPAASRGGVFGWLRESGDGLELIIGSDGTHLRFAETRLGDLTSQGWDPRLDPEPHVMATLDDDASVASLEYVNPHHNID
jgi:hypothetical protein